MTTPRSTICWECGQKLAEKSGKYLYVEREIDGHPRIVHKVCGNRVAKSRKYLNSTPEEPCPTKKVGGWRPAWDLDKDGER